MKLILGLTGPSGAGKTTAIYSAQQKGFFCIDCDKVAHKAMNSNMLCLNAVKAAFGEQTVKENRLDRSELARIAFSCPENTELLNKTVLPFIVSEILLLIEKSEEERILLDAPTLFESGLDEICSFVISVLSERNLRKERIKKRDNINEEQAELRLNAGKNDSFYIDNSDYTVYNNGTEEDFKKSFSEIIDNITEE